MQIVEKAADGLSRTFGVTVAVADLTKRLDAKLVEIAPQVNLKGFRPGKVPVNHVRKVYGKSILGDLLNEIVQEGVDKAVNDNAVRPAAQPDVSGLENLNDVLELKKDFAFDVAVDCLPEFEMIDISKLKLVRPVAAVDEADVQTALESLAKEAKSFETKDGIAEDGDAVVCDFVGKIDGEAFAGGTANGSTIVIGSGTYIPGFEEQLKGAKAGEARVLNVTFPDSYGVATLAGKDAAFEVTVTEVKAPSETKIDDELAKKVGLSDLDALKDALRSNLSNELAGASRQKLKRALLDQLDGAHSFELPTRMVDAEFAGIWQQVEHDRSHGHGDPDDEGKSDDELKAEYRTIAERRVRLGLVLAEIGRINGVEVKDEEVARAIQGEAMRYPGQEQQVYDFYRKNPQMVAQLRAPIFEEKVVDFIFSMAEVSEVTVSRAELEADDDAPASDGAPAKKPAAKKATKAKAEANPEDSGPEAKDEASSAEAAPAKKPASKKAAPKKKADSAE